jgi:GTPase SAR1 family protein
LTYAFYKKADGVIIAYDITETRTFESVTNWIESINQHAGQNVGKILVGNKVDLDEQR